MLDVYFFGCAKGITYHQAGHYWFGPRLASVSRDVEASLPQQVDGVFAHRIHVSGDHRTSEVPQGKALLVYTKRHTILAFWDRSGDDRSASNSAFVVGGHHGWDAVMEAARVHYPALFKRFDFWIELFDA